MNKFIEYTSIPWEGLTFNLGKEITNKLKGPKVTIFDMALSPKNYHLEIGCFKVNESDSFNIACLDFNYNRLYETYLKNDSVHLEGICFLNNPQLNTRPSKAKYQINLNQLIPYKQHQIHGLY